MGFLDGLNPQKILREIQAPGSAGGEDFFRGLDHYVQNFGDSADKTFGIGQPKPGSPTPPQAPPPSLITPTPIATDSDKKLAQRQMQATALSRKGRASTILSDDTLGSA